MVEHLSDSLQQAVRFILSIITRFYSIPVPGTDISVGSLFVSALVFLFGFHIVRLLFYGGDDR